MPKMRDPNWLSLGEIAALKLRRMPRTARGMAEMAKRQGWLQADAEGVLWRGRQGRGGGVEVHVRALPRGRQKLALRSVAKSRLTVVEAHREALIEALALLDEERAALLRLMSDEEQA